MKDLIWKPLAAILAIALLLVGAGTGFGWWLAARDRDAARVELVAERQVSAQYQVAIREQNRATEVLAVQKAAADTRGAQAQQVAAANGRRLDAAMAGISTARATTCAEAMPAVNAILEAIK
jgi:hypothetical protein